MKKIVSLMLILLLAVALLSACGGKKESVPAETDTTANAPAAGLKIVTTVFPEYDWVRNIMGDLADGAEIDMMLDTGADLHNFQPTVDDILKINNADLFLYVGGESDKWAEDVLAQAGDKAPQTLNLMETLGAALKEEERKEGMQADAEEEEEDGPVYDEHVWLSLKNAAALCKAISEKLAAVDGANADAYKANADAYIEKLNALDARYQAAVDAATVKTLLFGDRFPFRYLVEDYGLDYYAAFIGCSAETEASFETVMFLAGKADELGLTHVCVLESSDGRIAQTIRDNTVNKDLETVTFNSLQTTTAIDVNAGADYLSVMEQNLAALQTALS